MSLVRGPLHSVQVAIPPRSAEAYPVVVGAGALAELPQRINLSAYSKRIVLTDTLVARHWLAELTALLGDASSIVIEPGEQYKTLTTTERVWKELVALRADRHSLLINLGGGVIGDLGGFAASCYMRGIDFVQIPTTVLAQVDASVGGKVGIDFQQVKNLIGSFQQPRAVFCDTRTLRTLPDREFIAGFAEMVKHGAIANRGYFDRVVAKPPRALSDEDLADVIKGSVEIKAAVVAADERESGARKLLNFGHTVGHAVEAALLGEQGMLHGEAISLGMIAEARLSHLVGKLTLAELELLEHSLARIGLPTRLTVRIDEETLRAKIVHDKKNQGGHVRWVMLNSIGSSCFDQLADDPIVHKVLTQLGGQ